MTQSQTPLDAVALYQAILTHPDEDTPRLVYADWLDEHGEPERAEFIRAQCHLARTNESDEGFTADRLRAERLQRANWEEWVRPPGSKKSPPARFAESSTWGRGFPAGPVSVEVSDTPAQLRNWYAEQPISAVVFWNFDEIGARSDLWRLLADALPRLRAIKLDFRWNASPESRAVACRTLAAECRHALTRLEIDGDPTPEGLEAIVTSPHMRRLESLSLSVRGDDASDGHAQVLAEKMNLPALRELALGHRVLTPDSARTLGRADWFARLHALRFDDFAGIGSEELKELIGKRALLELRMLHIHHAAQFGSVVQLAGSRKLPGLVDFYLDGNHPRAEDVLKMAGGPQRFASLNLPGTLLNSPELAKVFAKPALHDLRRLVWAQRLKENELAALAASPMTQSLRWLELNSGWEGDVVAALLSAEWPHLERLVLGAGLSGESLTALFEGEKFPRLVSLSAWCWDGRAKFLKRLARSPVTARYRELDVRTEMTSAVSRELASSPHLNGIDRLVVKKGTASPADCKPLVTRFGKRITIEGFDG